MTSVKQKIAGIEKEREKIHAGVRKLNSDLKEQIKINAAAAHEMGADIQKMKEEMRHYTKDFYFGEGKTEVKK